MEIATYLLLILGVLGALDIFLFHSVSHGIRSHPDSKTELLTHGLRGPTYAALFLLVPNFVMKGNYAWILAGLFIVDLSISIWDFGIEARSRRFLGGLPSGEYVLHVIIAMLFGALVMSSMMVVLPWMHEPATFVYQPAQVAFSIRVLLGFMSAGVLFSGLQDAFAVWKMRKLPRKELPIETPQTEEKMALPHPWLSPSSWMKRCLQIAAIYNLLWGAIIVFFPNEPFRWMGVPPINYPGILQCLGMVVGVYGLGYWIASRDPLRHWPLVLVGLLGKILGPIGMVIVIMNGELPDTAFWTCVTNDLIWWVPFGIILRTAYNNHRPPGDRF